MAAIQGVRQFRVTPYTNQVTAVVLYVLEVSSDQGATWSAIQTADPNWPLGIIAGLSESTLVTAMQAAHAAEIAANFSNTNLWARGAPVAGPV